VDSGDSRCPVELGIADSSDDRAACKAEVEPCDAWSWKAESAACNPELFQRLNSVIRP
jgi:hypothetical protein